MISFFDTVSYRKSITILEDDVRLAVLEKLKYIALSENPLFFAKKLRGYKDIFRFRCNDYRIIFRLERADIILLMVKHRRDIYESL